MIYHLGSGDYSRNLPIFLYTEGRGFGSVESDVARSVGVFHKSVLVTAIGTSSGYQIGNSLTNWVPNHQGQNKDNECDKTEDHEGNEQGAGNVGTSDVRVTSVLRVVASLESIVKVVVEGASEPLLHGHQTPWIMGDCVIKESRCFIWQSPTEWKK